MHIEKLTNNVEQAVHREPSSFVVFGDERHLEPHSAWGLVVPDVISKQKRLRSKLSAVLHKRQPPSHADRLPWLSSC